MSRMASRAAVVPDLNSGPDPAYVQVKRFILDRIERGAIQRGARLMPERLLAEDLAVSRVTVRRALSELHTDNVLTPSHGRGWYVNPGRVSEPPNVLLSFTDMVRAGGKTPRTSQIGAEVRPATAEQARALGVRARTRLLELTRLRFIDQMPVAVTTSWLPMRRFPGLGEISLTDRSLYQLLQERYRVVPSRSEFTVESRATDQGTAQLLDIEPDCPILLVDQQTFDQNGKAFEIGNTLYRSDQYQFRATVLATETGNYRGAVSRDAPHTRRGTRSRTQKA